MNLLQANKGGKTFQRTAVVAAFALASATFGSTQAFAAIVCASPAVSIPQTIDGVYANFVTGVINTSGTVTNWDFNAYYNNLALTFWTGGNQTNIVGATPGEADVLAPGTMINGASPVAGSGGQVAATAFLAGVTNGYVGVVFFNDVTAAVNYGWASLTTTAGASGFPVTFNQYCYEDTGAGIMAGTTPVSLQSYSVD